MHTSISLINLILLVIYDSDARFHLYINPASNLSKNLPLGQIFTRLATCSK